MECHPISNLVPITDTPKMKTQHISKKNDWMDTYPQENSQEKKKSIMYRKNHFKKTSSLTMQKLRSISVL